MESAPATPLAWSRLIAVFLAVVATVLVYASLVVPALGAVTGSVLAVLAVFSLLSPQTPIWQWARQYASDQQIAAMFDLLTFGLTSTLRAMFFAAWIALIAWFDFLSVMHLVASVTYALVMMSGLVIAVRPQLRTRATFALVAACVAFLAVLTTGTLVARLVDLESAYRRSVVAFPTADPAFNQAPTVESYVQHHEQIIRLKLNIRSVFVSTQPEDPARKAITLFAATGDDRQLDEATRRAWQRLIAGQSESFVDSLRQDVKRYADRMDRRFVTNPFGELLSASTREIALLSVMVKLALMAIPDVLTRVDMFGFVLTLLVILLPAPTSRLICRLNKQYDPAWQPAGHTTSTAVVVGSLAFALLCLRATLFG